MPRTPSPYDYQLDQVQTFLTQRAIDADAARRAELDYVGKTGEALRAQQERIRSTLISRAGLQPHQNVIRELVRTPAADTPGYTVERVRFVNALGLSVEGLLAEPKACPGKCPVLLAPNGWSSSPESVMGLSDPDYQKAFGRTFAQDGYIVFAVFIPTSPGSPQASADLEEHAALLANLSGTRFVTSLETDKILSALDLLEQLPNADMERVAVFGISLGGVSSLYAAVLDARIKGIILSGTNVLTPRLDMVLQTRRFIYPQMYSWEGASLPDADELLVTLSPRPLCVELGQYDTSGDFDKAQANALRVGQVYAAEGKADRFKLVVHDERTTVDGHEVQVTKCKEFINQVFAGN